jgi:hypothetical protein
MEEALLAYRHGSRKNRMSHLRGRA